MHACAHAPPPHTPRAQAGFRGLITSFYFLACITSYVIELIRGLEQYAKETKLLGTVDLFKPWGTGLTHTTNNKRAHKIVSSLSRAVYVKQRPWPTLINTHPCAFLVCVQVFHTISLGTLPIS